ncbi:MAG: glycosyltransferase family 2 protein [Ruminiclostridium sp.]
METIVSIIIPVYNVRLYIDQCLESVVTQTFRDIEIILINDGSTDGSDLKCIEWADKDNRIVYISKKKEGLGPTRNLGIRIAKYEYIAFLDSDDWIDEAYIEKMYQCIIKNNSDMVFCEYYKFDTEMGKKRAFNTKINVGENTFLKEQPELIYGADVAMWIKLYKKKIFVENGILIPNLPYEDTATYAIIAANCDRISHVKEKLLFYRENREGSILNCNTNRKYAVEALQHLMEQLKQRELFYPYYEYLERFAVRFVSYTIREIKELDAAVHIKAALLFFLDKYFPGWKDPYALRFCTIGSNNLYCMVNQIPYDLEQTKKHTILDYMQVEENISIAQQYDYVCIDMQPDTLETLTKKETVRNLIHKVRQYYGPQQILLIKNKLAECYGEYEIENQFKDVEKIRNINEKLNELYYEFEKSCRGIHIIECNDEGIYFSDINSRHGCSPCHLNDMVFTESADRIIKLLKRNKKNR